MLWDEQAVRANIRNRDGKRVYYLGKGDQLTSTARDFLRRERIEILPGSQARPERYRLLSGGYAEEKPEHMTHLNSREMVSKTHPRILLRGKLDTLESEILLVMVGCGETWRALLQDALMLVRQVLAADVKDAPLPPWKLGGMDAEEVHRGSHHPEAFGLSGHLLPAPEQGLLAAQMNRLRAVCREAELAGIAAWQDGVLLRHEDCILALNRLSSYFYLLQLRAATGDGANRERNERT